MSEQDPHKTPSSSSISDALNNLITNATKAFAGNEIAEFIGTVALAEELIAKIIGDYFARDKERAAYLVEQFVGRASNEKKLAALTNIISQSGWEGDFPRLVSDLREIFELRNQLAHSYTDSMELDENDFVFQRVIRHRKTPVRLSILTAKKESLVDIITTQLGVILHRVSPAAGQASS
jgi:hypothetical protein